MFYSYDSILVEPIQCNRITVSDAKGLSEKEIVNKILIHEFDHYKSERLFTKNKIFDYTINRIDGPIKIKDKDGMDKNYYDISYSVKTIDPAWIAGNGKNEGLWVNNKSGFFVLIKNDNQYIFFKSSRRRAVARRPLTPPCVPFGTRRFSSFHRFAHNSSSR